MKGRGLARRLMQRLIDWARRQGMTAIIGQVLAENAPMLAFMRKMGAAIHRLPERAGGGGGGDRGRTRGGRSRLRSGRSRTVYSVACAPFC